ncbi:butyrophilin subfamily 2 member A1-like [Cetorhinus maximus]
MPCFLGMLMLDIRLSKISFLLQIILWTFHDTAAEFVVTAPPDPVVGVVGGNVILDCQLVPARAPENMEVRWIYMALSYSSPVIMFKDGAEDLTSQAAGYRGRTELFLNEIAHGNLSLKLKAVKVSDKGQYKCYVASGIKQDEIKVALTVSGTGRQPWIEMEGYATNGVRLACRSEGWFPNPPVQWVDGNGENVTAQPDTRYRLDAEGLMTVDSIIEVPKHSRNKYTCVINNQILKETQEAHIQIADTFFPSTSGWLVAFWILFILIAAAVCFAVWRDRKLQQKTRALMKSASLLENERLRIDIEAEKEKANRMYQALQEEIKKMKEAGKAECEKLQQDFAKEKIAIKEEHEQFKKEVDQEKASATAKYQKLYTECEQWKPLVQSEWKRIQSNAATVTLDARTANASLTVSPDGQTVKGGETLNVPDNPERFDSVPYVLGTEGFTGGTHYWEVKVVNKAYWDVGIANGSVQRKGMPDLCADAGFWTIGRDGEPYGISDAKRSTITVTTRPQKIGVFLELEAGRVSFYNADNMYHLYTFNANFSDKVYPFFWPGWDDTPLTICPVKN